MLSDSKAQWYAIRVKSNRERVTAVALRGKQLDVLLPAQRTNRPGAAGPRESLLFPGYLFCRFDVNRRLPILTIPGVVHIVGFGNVPVPVDPVGAQRWRQNRSFHFASAAMRVRRG
jgi:transcription antitermination factor NusG